jgi:hypothetical protein
MKTLKMFFEMLRRVLLGLFIVYWVVSIFYTAEKFFTGGSSAVVGWYKHIDSSLVARGEGWFLTKWSWKRFLAGQFANLAITMALHFAGRQSKRMPQKGRLPAWAASTNKKRNNELPCKYGMLPLRFEPVRLLEVRM